MRLLIHERLNLQGLLPKEGDFTTLKIVRELREALSFSEEEHSVINFKQDGDLITWSNPEDPEILNKEIAIGPKGAGIICAALEKLNEEKKLTEQFFSLYEKFCTEKGD